jgi:hypothetical protein
LKFRQLSLLSLAIALYLISGCGGSGYSASGGPPPPTTNVLNGQYAFVLSGFDTSAHQIGIAGSITADGMGHITGGSIDVNDNQVISSSSSALAGSYTFDSNSRGTITLTNTVGSVTNPLSFAFTLKADGSIGNLIGIDANGFIISGTMQKQDATAFSLAKIAGDFAFELDSRGPSQNTLLGRFTLSSSGTTTNVVLDLAVAGVGPTGPATGGTVAATFAAAGPNGSGRGTVSLTDNANVARSFVYYVVAAGTSLVMEMDQTGSVQTVYTGVASKQSTPFSSSSVNTAASVFALSGFDTVSPNDLSAVGVLTVTNSNTASLLWDADDVGLVSPQIALAGQAVVFDPNTGRGTIAVTGGHANGLFDNTVFYLTTSGNGFLLDATAGTNNRALAGRLQVQTGTFTQTTFSGKKVIHQTGVSVNDAGALEGLLSDSVSSNILTGTLFLDSKFPLRNPTLNLSGPVNENITIDSTTGRVTLTFNDINGANTNVLYMIGPDQYVGVDESAASHNTIPIVFADPQ